MGSYNVSAALQANNSAPVTNMVEQKYQRANELTLKYMADFNYAFTNTEKSDLFGMANECPAKGAYVSGSRNLVNAMLRTVIMYDDNCDAEADASRKAKPKVEEVVSAPSFKLFPNPNNGIMNLDYNLGNDSEATMKLFDVTGKLINTYTLQNNKGSISINEQNLTNGIYFYSILVKEKVIKNNKIVIIR